MSNEHTDIDNKNDCVSESSQDKDVKIANEEYDEKKYLDIILQKYVHTNNFYTITELNVSNQKLQSVKFVNLCINLEIFDCSENLLTSLEFDRYNKILILDCHKNKIESLETVHYCTDIEYLYCFRNRLQTLHPINTLTRLKTLYCNNNFIDDLSYLSNCTQLRTLYCNNNLIKNITSILHLNRITNLFIHGNNIENIDIQTRRYLEKIKYQNNEISIYDDPQNTHDTHVVKSVNLSINNILKDDQPDFNCTLLHKENLDDNIVKEIIKVLFDTTVHSVYLVSYGEIFAYVWQRIQVSEHKQELMKILSNNILESSDKCLTGKINSLISTLSGFYDDVKIQISDYSRISAVVISCKTKIVPYDSELHRNLVVKKMMKLGYDMLFIKPWIDSI